MLGVLDTVFSPLGWRLVPKWHVWKTMFQITPGLSAWKVNNKILKLNRNSPNCGAVEPRRPTPRCESSGMPSWAHKTLNEVNLTHSSIARNLLSALPVALGDGDGDNLLDFRQMLEALPVAIYTTDAEGRITFYNQAAAAFWGCQPELNSDK